MRIHASCCLLVIALALSGCGPSIGDVSGTVKYKGEPVAGATITFFDDLNATPSAVVGDDGTYLVKNVPAGKAKIAIVTPMAITMPGMPEPKTIAIPEKYRDREKSGLVCDVKGGRQVHNIDLVD